MVSRKSYTSEDYRREPEEAEGLELRNVVPGQVAVVSVSSNFAENGENCRLKRIVAERGGQCLEEPSYDGGKTEAIGAEINVNGKSTVLNFFF